MTEGASLVEVRLLDGPNLYFPRPAAKVTLNLGSLRSLPLAQAREFATEIGLGRARPGPPESAFRQRFAARAVAHLVRELARAGGVSRLAVRSRPGTSVDELVVAYPWRYGGRAEALARGLADALDAVGTGSGAVTAAVAAAGERLAQAPTGQQPRLIRPRIPVVAVTGTNGKTTTSRMLGHIAQRSGRSVGWSSTDGVYINGELVEAGDYSGPSGAGRVLQHPGVELAVTETARGGILRRGVGVAYNDISVVTNISADHLGLGGIDTLDQLAEVKAVITKITKPSGWCVLNADDPRTFAMRLGTKAQIWVFTRDPDSPSGRAVLDDGGRVTTLLDGWVCVLRAGSDPLPVVEVADVPMTLAGLSRVNVENTLAATSAALALGFTENQVAAGLTSFQPAQDNPGRMNIWSVPVDGGAISVVVDLAHNEAGLEALLEIMNGIRPPGGRLLLGVGTAGDRTDDVFVRLGEMAALGADVVEIAHKSEYLRGRPAAELGALIRDGAAGAGVHISREHDSELPCLVSLVTQSRPGDVVAMMTHQDRAQIDDWLTSHGGTRDNPATLRAKAQTAH
ncbi:MAG: putative ligase [Propionibacteriaceae bacterium]|nr:putative ligase [Propionibacteriaceae bacterium]